MRPWTRKSASIQPRTRLRISGNFWKFLEISRNFWKFLESEGGAVRGEVRSMQVHQRVNHATQSLFRRLVLGWIEADFRVQGRIFQHFSKSTRKSASREQILQINSKIKIAQIDFAQFSPVLPSFIQFFSIFLNFPQFFPILRSFHQFLKIFFKCLLNFAEFSRVLPSFAEFCRVFTSFAQFSRVFASFREFSPVFTSFRQFSRVL